MRIQISNNKVSIFHNQISISFHFFQFKKKNNYVIHTSRELYNNRI
jgi:hypothetical protein